MNLLHRLALHDYLFWAVVLGFILLSALMVLPFVSAIISAYILAYFIRPLFLKLRPQLGSSLAALLCIIITIVVVVVPIGVISLQILNQVSGVSTSQKIANIVGALVTQPFIKGINIDAVSLKASIVLAMNNIVNSTINSVPSFALGLVITLNGMFYLLCNWDNLVSHLKKYLPFKNNDTIITELGGTADAIIHGHVLIAVLEAAIAFVGFSLFGVDASLIFAVLIFILAFVPSIGPFLVWGPLALYYFSIGQYATMWGIILTGLILMIGIEFFLYTRFVGSRSKIHPFIMLLGVLGGLSVFGIFGFIIGPLLLANSIEVIEVAIESHEARTKKR
jgi:predicted PurR-regulated permease PerM